MVIRSENRSIPVQYDCLETGEISDSVHWKYFETEPAASLNTSFDDLQFQALLAQ